jgi:hypothetical protein
VIIISLAICTVFTACFLTYKKNESVEIKPGVWYASKLIGFKDGSPLCEDIPRFVFTEGGDSLVESSDLSDLLYQRLGVKHTAYTSANEYTEILDGLNFRDGYGAQYFHDTVKAVYRIDPSVSSGIEYEEVYLLITENELYMGYCDDEKITALYELRLNEILPTYVYTATYTSSSTKGGSVTLDTKTHKGSITFSLWSSYIATGSYVYENSKVIFTTDDSFGLKFVFLDVGNALIFSAKDSDLKDFGGPFEDGETFGGFYQLYGAASDTAWFDISGDGKQELISANIGQGSSLWYIVHSEGQTLSNKTVPFEKYDDIRFEAIGDSLYLMCEYGDKDFNSYRYLVTYDGEDLILTPEE